MMSQNCFDVLVDGTVVTAIEKTVPSLVGKLPTDALALQEVFSILKLFAVDMDEVVVTVVNAAHLPGLLLSEDPFPSTAIPTEFRPFEN